MNIIEHLEEALRLTAFENYEVNIIIRIEVGVLIEKSNRIIDYFNKKDSEISNIDDYIDFLFLKKYKNFNNLFSFIKEEKKEEFKNIVDFIIERYKKINKKSLIKYLNFHYDQIFKLDNLEVLNETFDLAFTYHSGCLSIIKKFIQNKFFMILKNIEECMKVIYQHDELVEAFKQTESKEDKEYLDVKSYFKLAKVLQKMNLINESKLIIDKIISFGREIHHKTNESNILINNKIIKNIRDFLIEVKNINAIEFDEISKKIDIELELYLKKHGHTFSCKIPYDELIKPLKDKKIAWQVKMLMLTHSNIEGNTLESYHNTIGKNNIESLADLFCNSASPKDKYFTISKQQSVIIYDSTYLLLLQYFINEEKIKEFMSMLAAELRIVCDYFNLDFDKNEFEVDLNILLNQYMLLFQIGANEFALKGLNYGITMFTIALTEKLLRLFYASQKKDQYISIDWYSLGSLLNEEDDIMCEFFGKDGIKLLKYFLINGKNNSVGLNYRNNYAHYKNIETKDFQYGTTLKCLQIFLMITNDLFKTIPEEFLNKK